MKFLDSFEEIVRSSIDIDALKQEIENCFKHTVENSDGNVVAKDLFGVLGNDGFFYKFSGVNIHLLDGYGRRPVLRVRLDIFNVRSGIMVAWYELEYGTDGEKLDEYFDLF